MSHEDTNVEATPSAESNDLEWEDVTSPRVLLLEDDPQFKDHLLFYEYFDGDNGRGVGASHQTGWTGLVALLLAPQP